MVSGFRSPMELLYQAAKKDIPAEAVHLSGITNRLQTFLDVMDVATAKAGEPAAMVSMLHVAGDVHAVLRRAVKTMDNCSAALLATANDYAQTDAQARADYDKLGPKLRNSPLPKHPTTPMPKPEKPGYTVDVPPFLYPPGHGPGKVRIDPNPTPVDPDDEQKQRGDGGDDDPHIPEVAGGWE